MMRNRTLRPLHLLLAAGLAAAAVTTSATAASAATVPVSVQLKGGQNNAYSLGSAQGTVDATRGGTSATYALTLCGQSTYPKSTVSVTAGSASASHSVSPGVCTTFTGTLRSGTALTSATVTVTGATFAAGGVHTTYSTSRTVSFPGSTTPPPTPTPTTLTFPLQVKGGPNNAYEVGRADVTLTGTRGGTSSTYSVQLCGQSSYPGASVRLTAGTATANHSVSPGVCQTFSGTLTSTSAFSSATVTATGATFGDRGVHTTYTQARTVGF